MFIYGIINLTLLAFAFFKGLYESLYYLKKRSHIRENIEIIGTSIQFQYIPFFFNQRKTNSFCFFFNFIFILFLISTKGLMLGHAYCMESDSSGENSDVDMDNRSSNSNSNVSMANSDENNYTSIFQENFDLDEFLNMFSSNPEISTFIYENLDITSEETIEYIEEHYNQSLETYIIDTQTELFLPTIESFSYPAIKNLNIYDLNSKNIYENIDGQIEKFYLSSEEIKSNFLDYPFEDNRISSVDGYVDRLNNWYHRNSLFISKLYILHNKTIMPYFSDINTDNINSTNLELNNLLNNNFDSLIKNHIKSFIFVNQLEYENLDQKIKFLVEYLLELNNSIERQQSFFDFNFENSDLYLNHYLNSPEFKNCLNFELNPNFSEVNSRDTINEISSKYIIFEDLVRVSFDDTNNFLKNAYFDESQLQIRDLYRNTDNNINQQFIRNFTYLHENIINRGMTIDYSRLPGFTHLIQYQNNNAP